MKYWKEVLAVILATVVAVSFYLLRPEPKEEVVLGSGAATTFRQEVNITDAYLYAGSGANSTTSAIVLIDPSKYSGTVTYAFEVIASTTSATNANIYLANATSSAIVAKNTVNGTSYTRYRTSFTPITATEYQVVLGSESVGKGIIAARIVIVQVIAGDANSDATSTQTQIEIGCQQSFTTFATSSCSEPKYWNYDSSKWDGTTTFYAEVSYANTQGSATTTNIFRTEGYSTVTASSTLIDVAAWGGGGGGADGATNEGGAGGGGGAFASSTQAVSPGDTIRLYIANTVVENTVGATTSASTTVPTAIVIAQGGRAASGVTIGVGGKATFSTGTVTKDGGDGGTGDTGTGDESGGGGGSAGPHAVGGTGQNFQASTGGVGGQGDGTFGGTGGIAGDDASVGDGGDGTANVNGGGGGGGADDGDGGGNGGVPGGGGGGGEVCDANQCNGAGGQITFTFRPTATTTIAIQESDGTGDGFTGWTDKAYIVDSGDFNVSTSTRKRSTSFTPTNGRNYRLVVQEGYNGATHAIYNAKIVVEQADIFASQLLENSSPIGINGGTTAANEAQAQSFIASGSEITGVDLKLSKALSPTDTVVVDIVSTLGGSSLAQATKSASSVSTTKTVYTLTFGTPVTLTAGNTYYIQITRSPDVFDGSNVIRTYSQQTDVYTDGSKYSRSSGSWSINSDNDLYFKLNGTPLNFTLLEPQYLLAPFKLLTGTSLQSFLTYFDPAEWSNAGVSYLLDVDAANGSGSDILLQDSTGGTTYATVNNPDNFGTSTLTCIPSIATLWDTLANTNGDDVYGVRVLARVSVGGSGTSVCSSGSNNTPKIRIHSGTIKVQSGTLSI